MRLLHNSGFHISVARHIKPNENSAEIESKFSQLFALNGLPSNLHIVAFPDFLPPGALPEVPHITTHCMTTYQNEEQRKNYMCANSKMIIKKDNAMQVYACTLVDDDEDYFLSTSLTQSMSKKVNLKHHRCYSCFAFGASCSEM